MGGGIKDDRGYTKNFQDGPPRVALENGPKQDCAAAYLHFVLHIQLKNRSQRNSFFVF